MRLKNHDAVIDPDVTSIIIIVLYEDKLLYSQRTYTNNSFVISAKDSGTFSFC
jgi:hypothetical protein